MDPIDSKEQEAEAVEEVEEVEEAPNESFLDDLGNQPELPLGAATPELVEVAEDGYVQGDSGDEQP